MTFSSIFKKASNLLGFSSPTSLKPPPLDGEIIYCKNNVCVHPPANLSTDSDEHHQGYLTLRSTHDKVIGPTLILTWIPNSTLKKNTRSIENSPKDSNRTTTKYSPRKNPRQEFATTDFIVSIPTTCLTDLSPLESNVSFASDIGSTIDMNIRKKLSIDNAISALSLESQNKSVACFPDGEHGRKLSGECDGKLDSVISSLGAEQVHNNQKCISNIRKVQHIGQHVNDLYVERVSEIGSELHNLAHSAIKNEINDIAECHNLEAKECNHKSNKNSAQAIGKHKTSSNRSVSIEMEGDSICVTMEELDDEVLIDTFSDVEQQNLRKNFHKYAKDLYDDDDVLSHCSSHTGRYCDEASEERTSYVGASEEVNEEKNIAENDSDSHSHRANVNINSSVLCSVSDENYGGPLNSTFHHHPQSLNLGAVISTDTRNVDQLNTLVLPDISIAREQSFSNSSTTTSGPDSEPPSSCSSSPTSCQMEQAMYLDSPSSPESVSHNLQFPENSVGWMKKNKDKKSGKEQICGVFSVDLGQMRSLRVFYSDPENTRGQIVIASLESQYKILHFHNGGLDKLAEIFQDWSLFATQQDKQNDTEKHYKQFMIVKPSLTNDQCHPEEGVYSMVTEDIWHTHMMDDGVIEDDYQLRKAIFFGSLDPCIRHEVWPFLLHYFSFDTTFDEREHIRNDKYIEYQNIRKKRESMTEEEQQVFWRTVQCTVEKDVIRTDRSHPHFKGDNNPNLQILTNILLNYAVANPDFGYTQGMSDLLAPVLAEVQKEVDAYWCFVGLMQKTIFVSSPTDCDMDKQLTYLRELLRLMQPRFFEHLSHLGDDAMELLFAHRWILLCFKREFNEKAALCIWESCWAHYQTNYFHLFICVAIVAIYGEDIVEQGLPADDILLHFSSLACHMSGELVLRKARGLLHEYTRRPVIPCTLHGLCSNCGQGMWDSGHIPKVECVGNHCNSVCPYLSTPNSPANESTLGTW